MLLFKGTGMDMEIVVVGLLVSSSLLYGLSVRFDAARRMAFVAYSAALAYLLYAFMTLRFDLVDVYVNAALNMEPYYRVVAFLSNIGESTMVVFLPLAIASLFKRSAVAQVVLALVPIYVLLQGAADTLGFDVEAGLGLNPLLKNVWALPHPLSVLLGYGAALTAAIHLSTWAMRGAWILLSAGILMGAYWSYVTFGWGGYWVWDPVETALLTVWLSVVTALHLGVARARWLTVGAILGALGLNQGGFSELHSFAGRTYLPDALLVASMALMVLAVLRLAARPPSLPVKALVGYGTAVTTLYLYASLVVPALLRRPMPSGDTAIAIYYPLLLPAVYAALYAFPLLAGWDKRLVAGVSSAMLAVSAVLASLGVSITPGGSPLTALFATAMAISLPIAWAGLAHATMRRRIRQSLAAVHALLLAALLAVIVSGPYAYSQEAFSLASLGPGGTAFLDIGGYPAPVALLDVNASLGRELVDVPPWLAYVPPNYSGFVIGIGGAVNLRGVNFEVYEIRGNRYMVVLDGPGVQVEGYVNGVPITRLAANGTVVRFPAPLDLVESLRYPEALSRYLACLDGSALIPNDAMFTGRVSVGGRTFDVSARFDASGELKGIRGLVPGVGHVADGLDDIYVVFAPTVYREGGHAALALYVRAMLDQCNARAAYVVGATGTGNGSLSNVLSLAAKEPGWVVAVKRIPLVNLMWAASALAIATYVLAVVLMRRPRRGRTPRLGNSSDV